MAWNDDDMREMLGKVMVSVKQNGEELIFTDGDGIKYIFYHSQSCCESVDIDDIEGELDWLVGLPMLMVEEVHNDASPKTSEYGYEPESYTWTFYKFATNRGTVVVKWYGTSNGYYSESVDFRIDKP